MLTGLDYSDVRPQQRRPMHPGAHKLMSAVRTTFSLIISSFPGHSSRFLVRQGRVEQ